MFPRPRVWLFLSLCCLHSVSAAQPVRVIQSDRMLSGHSDSVTCLAFFPDSVRLASGSRDRTVKIWNSITGRLVRTLEGHEGPVYSVAVSPDGRWVASGSADHTVRVWDVSNGDQIAQLEGHRGSVRCLAFLPDGTLVSGGLEGLRRWDVTQEKLLWKIKARFNVDAVAASPDGTRVALTDDSGTSCVWDVKNAKRLAQFGKSELQPLCIALSSDGTQVYYQSGNGMDFHRWDIAANRELELPTGFGSPEAITMSPDGKRIFRAGQRVRSAQGVEVLDTTKFRPVFELALRLFEEPTCVAVSPDGKRVAYGSGGRRESPFQWQPGHQNLIVVVALPETNESPTGQPAGQVSWDVVPARLRLLDGHQVPLAGRFWASELPINPQPQARQLCPGLDVVWTPGAVLFHRNKGELDEVLVDEKAGFSDVSWDGSHIWVAGQGGGVWVLDREGKLLARIGAVEGLGPAEQALALGVLGPGRVLVAGAPRPLPTKPGETQPATLTSGGWCSVIEYGGGGAQPEAPPRVKPLFVEAQLTAWPQAAQGQPAFVPACIIRPNVPLAMKPGDKPAHELWIVCRTVGTTVQPVVRVNAQTLAYEAFNVEPASPRSPGATMFMKQWPPYSSPLWLNDHELLCGPEGQIDRCTLSDKGIDTASWKLVCDSRRFNGYGQLLPQGGRVYVPGTQWFSIDLRTLWPLDLGPGLRVNGELVWTDIAYFDSAHLGLAGLSVARGEFYRFSMEGAHPLSVHGTLDVPEPPRQVPPEGAIDRAGSTVTFSFGNGTVMFDEVRLGQVSFHYPPRAPQINDYTFLVDRVREHPEERQRVGITEQQLQQLNDLRRHAPFSRPDKTAFVKMFEVTRSAPDEAVKQKAIDALFQAVRQLGDDQVREAETYVKNVRDVFSERQWRMLHYQEPPPKAQQKAVK